MDPTLRFRSSLLHRLLGAAGATAVLAVPLTQIVGCGDVVVTPPGDSGGAGGSGGGATTTTTTTSTTTTATSTTATSTSVSVSSSVVSSSASTGQPTVTECFEQGDTGVPCPAAADALPKLQVNDCSDESEFMWTESVVSGPWVEGSACCYEVVQQFCGVGRPYLVEGRARTAPLGEAASTAWSDEPLRPCLDGLSAADRDALADAWAKDGALEHASVAAFGRFALDLLAVGAPAELVELAHRAALDEIRHARLCLALASAYRGAPLAPSPFPFEGAVRVVDDLVALAVSAAEEGCIGETLASVIAAEQRAVATDPAVRAALAVIADDEARHAELAYRTVAWAIRVGGAEVRAAVKAVFANAARTSRAIDASAASPALAAHGRLDAAAHAAAVAIALREVVLPAAAALLAEPQAALIAAHA